LGRKRTRENEREKLFSAKRKKSAQKVFDRPDVVIALGKAWKRRNRG
jgi:hypothetical protein